MNLQTFDVFEAGQEGYHTYRIPSIVATKEGTLLAFCEGRIDRPDQSENDMALKRSTDRGETWSPVETIASFGRSHLNNPQAVVLRESGRVLFMFVRYAPTHGPRPGKKGAGGRVLEFAEAGYEGDKVCRIYTMHSDDDGETWSDPEDVTRSARRAESRSMSTGPGIGVQLRRGAFKGRILMPCNHRYYGEDGEIRQCVHAIYSDDGGKSWAYGEDAPEGSQGQGNEVQFVELADGSVMLNSRSKFGNNRRKVATSRDGGITWSGLVDDPALIEPMCMGSFIRHGDPLDGEENRILLSNPASLTDRVNGTVRLTYDEGKSWPVSRVICPGNFAYSCLAVLPGGDIGCLYETGREHAYEKIAFARFSLDWLEGK